MKTYIIQLEKHDDLDSARDKLKGAKARRVIFVWPKSGKSLSDYYSLSLLKREADRLGLSISFITKNQETRENARSIGIPLFSTLGKAQKTSWLESPHRKIVRNPAVGYERLVLEREMLHPQKKKSGLREVGRVTAFLLGILSLVVLVLFLYPSAVVKISPVKTEQNVSFTIKVNTEAEEVNLAGIIPGKSVPIELSGLKTGESSGIVKVGATAAKGVITVTNLSLQQFSLLKGTRFVPANSSNMSFASTTDAAFDGTLNQSVDIPVIAEQPGEDGNLPAGTNFIPQSIQAISVSLVNQAPFKGGTSVNSPSPTDEDYAKARQELMDQLKKQAVETLLTDLSQDSVLIPMSLAEVKTTEIKSTEPGSPADHFTLEIKADFSAVTYRQSDVTSLAQSILNANLNGDLLPVSGTLNLKAISAIIGQQGEYSWNIAASQLVAPRLEEEVISQSLINLPVTKAESYLDKELALDKPSEVIVNPGWWKRMPFVYFRIQVEED